jgi:hypothetical protein
MERGKLQVFKAGQSEKVRAISSHRDSKLLKIPFRIEEKHYNRPGHQAKV